MTVHATTEFFKNQYKSLANSLPGHSRAEITAARQAALETLVSQGFPTSRDEVWKYTSVAPILKREFSCQPGNTDASKTAFEKPALVKEFAAHLVFVNGILDPQVSTMPDAVEGIHIQPIAERLEAAETPDAVLLGLPASEKSATAFQSMNTAFMSTGVVIELDEGIVCDQPIYLSYVGTQADRATHVRNIIRLKAGSVASVIEHYTGAEEAAALTNHVTCIDVGDNARCTHYKIQQESAKKYHIGHIQVDQGKDSYFKSFSLALGAALSKTDILIRQNGQGCESIMDGLFIGHKRQHMDHHTCVEHLHPNGVSDECYRGVMDDAAKGIFNGRVVVHPQAQKTNASQSNKNLLLSDKAEIDTKPELEIYADDVKCAHGATVGQLDLDRLFYLQSRGIDADTAYILLIFAFLEDVITRLDNAELRKSIELSIIERLPSGDILRDAVVSA